MLVCSMEWVEVQNSRSKSGDEIRTLDLLRCRQHSEGMDITSEEESFLKDLVKASRQRIHQVKWVDRDGTQRLTALNQADFARVNALASQQKLSAAELLRKAAFIPVTKRQDEPKNSP